MLDDEEKIKCTFKLHRDFARYFQSFRMHQSTKLKIAFCNQICYVYWRILNLSRYIFKQEKKYDQILRDLTRESLLKSALFKYSYEG